MTVALEAFKAGEYDFIYENHSKRWARDYSGPRFDNGVIIKRQLKLALQIQLLTIPTNLCSKPYLCFFQRNEILLL